MDNRAGSVFHVTDPNGHHLVIISDREFTDCGKASEYRYASQICRCDACTDVKTKNERRRRSARNARRRRYEEA